MEPSVSLRQAPPQQRKQTKGPENLALSGRPTLSAEGRNNVVGRKGGGQETQGEQRNARARVCVCR